MALEDGDYRFKSACPAESNRCLSIRSSGQVVGASLDKYSDDQKWRVKKRSDGVYDVINLGTNSPLSVNPPSKGDIAYTLNVRGAKDVPWELEDYRGHIIFKCSGKYAPNVMDLSTRDRLVLWDRTDKPNQLWIAENLSGGYAPIPQALPTPTPAPKIKPHWVTVDGANIPPNAIQCGWETDLEPLYLARVKTSDARGIGFGTAGHHFGNCRVTNYRGQRVFPFNTYEVLVADEGTYKWVPTPANTVAQKSNTIGFPSENRTHLRPVIAGSWPQCAQPALVLRSCYNDAVLPGYTWTTGEAYVEDGGTCWPIGSSNCEVLCYVE